MSAIGHPNEYISKINNLLLKTFKSTNKFQQENVNFQNKNIYSWWLKYFREWLNLKLCDELELKSSS